MLWQSLSSIIKKNFFYDYNICSENQTVKLLYYYHRPIQESTRLSHILMTYSKKITCSICFRTNFDQENELCGLLFDLLIS